MKKSERGTEQAVKKVKKRKDVVIVPPLRKFRTFNFDDHKHDVSRVAIIRQISRHCTAVYTKRECVNLDKSESNSQSRGQSSFRYST